MAREKGRYLCEGEDGAQYTIIHEVDVLSTSTMDRPGATTEGLPSYWVAGGGRANYIDPKTFKIVATGELVRRV